MAYYDDLLAEIANDPMGIGYLGKTSLEITNLINEVGLKGEKINNPLIDCADIWGAVDPDEFWDNFISADPEVQREISLIVMVLGFGNLQLSSANNSIQNTSIIVNKFIHLTSSKPSLLALLQKDASRAEVLGFETVRKSDVERAIGGVVYNG